jgi:hypothetical protein
MKSSAIGFLAGSVSLLLAVMPLLAHHSFSAEFDQNKPVTLTGVVTKVEWANPHTHFTVEGKDESGNVATWEFETGSSNALLRRGWTQNSMKAGDVVTVQGLRAKDRSMVANARTVTLADGRKVFAGSADDGVPAATGGVAPK